MRNRLLYHFVQFVSHASRQFLATLPIIYFWFFWFVKVFRKHKITCKSREWQIEHSIPDDPHQLFCMSIYHAQLLVWSPLFASYLFTSLDWPDWPFRTWLSQICLFTGVSCHHCHLGTIVYCSSLAIMLTKVVPAGPSTHSLNSAFSHTHSCPSHSLVVTVTH